MPLTYQNKELRELMKDFYTLTGIRIVLFDEGYNEIFAHPEECIPFCSHMRQNPDFYKLCRESDNSSFEACKKTHSFTMYKCHAGLIECTAPIIENGTIIGYIMFGQVSDNADKEEFLKTMTSLYPESDVQGKISKIKFKKTKQLLAASKILETCTSYILAKEMIKPSRMHLFNRIDEFISKNLSSELNAEVLCRKFNISRTSLYEVMKPYTQGGVAGYIKEKRLSKAKELLKSTDMTVTEISDATGFSDYNYFLRSFKKQFGVSAKKYRKSVV